MIQTRAVQSQAEAHRRDLLSSAGPRRADRKGSAQAGVPPVHRSATGFPVPGGRAVHRGMAPRLGAWLIDFGTKLGGASIRTS
jgi:hypothetical protein